MKHKTLKLSIFIFLSLFSVEINLAQIYTGDKDAIADCELSARQNWLFNKKVEAVEENELLGVKWLDSGEWLIQPEFEKIQNWRHGFLPVKKDNVWGFYNHKGEEILPCQYSRIAIIDGGHTVIVQKGVYYGMVDLCDRKEVMECQYDKLMFTKENTIQARIRGKWGIYDFNGNELIEPKYDNRFFFNEFGVAKNWKNYSSIEI
ncbi:MAG: WG repeat-containing protein [Bacteroidota bacterium]